MENSMDFCIDEILQITQFGLCNLITFNGIESKNAFFKIVRQVYILKRSEKK